MPLLLDLILSHDPMEVEELRYLAPVGKSDRCVLVFNFRVDRIVNCKGNDSKKNFHKGNYEEARRLFGAIEWGKRA